MNVERRLRGPSTVAFARKSEGTICLKKCGGSSGDEKVKVDIKRKSEQEVKIGILSNLFRPDPRTAEIGRVRSLIKENYGKREIMSYLIELNRLGDPVAMQIGRAAESNKMAEMQRLIRSL